MIYYKALFCSSISSLGSLIGGGLAPGGRVGAFVAFIPYSGAGGPLGAFKPVGGGGGGGGAFEANGGLFL